jgi:GAF domain-containing protein
MSNKTTGPGQLTRDNSVIKELLTHPEKRKSLGLFCKDDFKHLDYLIENPWIDLKKIIESADRILEISPDTPRDDILYIMCKETAVLTNAKSTTCRTYNLAKNYMLASASYNWNTEREPEIPREDTIAGYIFETKTHYCVPDIASEPLYKEKEKIHAMGLNSMLALPILVTDYEGAEKKQIFIGSLQLYFEEKNKQFYSEQIKLLKSIINRFSYVLALQSKRELQRKAGIIQESRRALISVIKRLRSLDEVLAFIVARMAELINVSRCSLFVIEQDPDGQKFAVLVAGFPLAPQEHTYGITLTFDEHPAFAEVYDIGEPLLIENARQDPRMKANYRLYLDKKIENVYFVPLKDENNVVTNVLVLDGDESRPLEKDELYFCNALMQDIELCIQTSLHSQQRHDFLNQMLSFGAIAKVYTKKQASPDVSATELNNLFKKLHRSMLTVNDIIADRLPLAHKEPFNLNEVISERLDAYYFPPQVSVKENISSGQILINADPRKVGRIIGNLLDNAHKKLEELKQGELEIYTYIEGGYAAISIANTGTIPPEVQEILNENKPVLRQDKEGSLGLSVVKLFTVMHNGIFEYESSIENNRTVFHVKLPV